MRDLLAAMFVTILIGSIISGTIFGTLALLETHQRNIQQQEITDNEYWSVDTDWCLKDELRPVIEEKFSDGIITREEYEEIKSFEIKPNWKAQLRRHVKED